MRQPPRQEGSCPDPHEPEDEDPDAILSLNATAKLPLDDLVHDKAVLSIISSHIQK